MVVQWREHYCKCLWEAMREEPGIQRLLAVCGLLKFLNCQLMVTRVPASILDIDVEH
jgi:hypothetical protein